MAKSIASRLLNEPPMPMLVAAFETTPRGLAITSTINRARIPSSAAPSYLQFGILLLRIQLEALGATLEIAPSFDSEETANSAKWVNPEAAAVVQPSSLAAAPSGAIVTSRQLSDAHCEWEVSKSGGAALLEGTVRVFANVESSAAGKAILTCRILPLHPAFVDARGRRIGSFANLALWLRLRQHVPPLQGIVYSIDYRRTTESREYGPTLGKWIEPREESLAASEPKLAGMRDAFNLFPAPVSDQVAGLPPTTWHRVEQAIRRTGGSKNG